MLNFIVRRPLSSGLSRAQCSTTNSYASWANFTSRAACVRARGAVEGLTSSGPDAASEWPANGPPARVRPLRRLLGYYGVRSFTGNVFCSEQMRPSLGYVPMCSLGFCSTVSGRQFCRNIFQVFNIPSKSSLNSALA